MAGTTVRSYLDVVISRPDMTQEEIEYRKEEYGLNDPVVVQYGEGSYKVYVRDIKKSLKLKKELPEFVE